MSAFIHLWSVERPAVATEYHAAQLVAQEQRETEWDCVVRLQSWWRMHLAIKRVARMNEAARMIQRNTQNVVLKIRRRKLVIKTLRDTRQGAYHASAVMLQSLWRGHWSRKTIHDFYGRWRPFMQQISDEAVATKQTLAEFRESEVARLEENRRQAIRRAHELKVSREHHLIGTQMISGVYDARRKGGNHPVSESELRMSVRGLGETRPPAMHLTRFGQPSMSSWKGYATGTHGVTTLKPIQGPFKDPEEVARLKNLQPMPSLRAQTDFRSLEQQADWVRRVNPGFKPFNQTTKPFNPYQRKLLMQSTHGPRDGDLSCRVPTKLTDTLFVQGRFDATIVGVDTFDGSAV
eukprot:gene5134-5278_t